MSDRAKALAQAFAEVNNGLISLLERATSEQWRSRTTDDGELRSVGVIAHHFAGRHVRIARRVEALASGTEVPARHPELFDVRNAQEARDHSDPDQRATIERLRETDAAVAELIASLSDDQLERTGHEDPDAPSITTREVIELRQIGHVRSHLATIQTVLRDQPPPIAR